MNPIQIVLADDHAVVRKGIREFLEDEPDMLVVAEAADGATARDLILAHLPTVAILDIRMPQVTGIDVARWVHAQKLPVGVLILTSYDDDPFVMAAVQAGARGYVLKDAEAEQIVAAVRAVAAGQMALGPNIADKLRSHLAGAPADATTAETLTDREREVLAMAAGGFTNRGIGHKLGISERTVQGHLANIYGKLQVASRTEAVTRALKLGWIELPGNSH